MNGSREIVALNKVVALNAARKAEARTVDPTGNAPRVRFEVEAKPFTPTQQEVAEFFGEPVEFAANEPHDDHVAAYRDFLTVPYGAKPKHGCSLGVGCDETGICYAIAHGQPDQCGYQGHAAQGGLQRHSLGDEYPWIVVGYGDGRWAAENAVNGTKLVKRATYKEAQSDIRAYLNLIRSTEA